MARARRTKTKSAPTARQSFKCPECGKTFTRAASLGAHRRRAHGVVGARAQAVSARVRGRGSQRTAIAGTKAKTAARRARTVSSRPRRSARTSRASVDRDALLRSLFPNGVPAREAVIRSVNSWLDEAERLAALN